MKLSVPHAYYNGDIDSNWLHVTTGNGNVYRLFRDRGIPIINVEDAIWFETDKKFTIKWERMEVSDRVYEKLKQIPLNKFEDHPLFKPLGIYFYEPDFKTEGRCIECKKLSTEPICSSCKQNL
jgi:hypothetical protein